MTKNDRPGQAEIRPTKFILPRDKGGFDFSGFTIPLDTLFVLLLIVFRTHLEQTAAAQAVVILIRNIIQLLAAQYHRLTLTQQY